MERSGGWTGIAIASAPTIAFVTANALGGLAWAFIALAATASVAFAVRLVRRESLRAALVGWPLTGIGLNRLARGPRDWRRNPALRRVYNLTSLTAAGICFVNFTLGGLLSITDQLAAMAVMDVAVLPVPFVLAAFTVAAARRAIHRSPATPHD